ncbi:MAG: hypothetical protein AAF615_04290 [Pseudomonadota bacterium]
MTKLCLQRTGLIALAMSMAAPALAQTVIVTETQPGPALQIEQPAATQPGERPPAPAIVTAPGTRSEDVAPGDPESANIERVFVDTGVSDVRVSDVLTVATMNRSPLSACPSNEYVYERDRPKWLFQTGRLLQALKEGATVRVSFTCQNGLQSINAMQFLSPPGAQVAGLPRRNQSVEAVQVRQAAAPAPVRAPALNIGDTREERVRRIPLP